MRLKQERRSESLKRDLEHKVEAYCWISREKINKKPNKAFSREEFISVSLSVWLFAIFKAPFKRL